MNNCRLIEVKPIIQDPYYDAPSWINDNIDRRDFVILDGKSSEKDVELFLILLLGYNNINIKQDKALVINELLSEDEIALSGGVLFIGEDKKIFPSCCCGLESWKEVLDAAISKESPWLGHDPNPCFEYIGDSIRIWSDNFNKKQASNIGFIECDRSILIEKLNLIRKDLIEFSKGPLYKYFIVHDSTHANQIIQQFEKWFSLNII